MIKNCVSEFIPTKGEMVNKLPLQNIIKINRYQLSGVQISIKKSRHGLHNWNTPDKILY